MTMIPLPATLGASEPLTIPEAPPAISETLHRMVTDFRLRREVALRAGLSDDTVYAVVNRRKAPSKRTLSRLAAALDVSEGDLIQQIEVLPVREARRNAHRLKDIPGGQVALAERMGVRQPQLHRWLSGKVMPNTRTIKRLADELGKTPETLLVELYQKRMAIAGKDSEISGAGLDV